MGGIAGVFAILLAVWFLDTPSWRIWGLTELFGAAWYVVGYLAYRLSLSLTPVRPQRNLQQADAHEHHAL